MYQTVSVNSPFVKIIVPAASGLVVGLGFGFPLGWTVYAAIAVWALAVVLRGHRLGDLLMWMSVFVFFVMVGTWRKPAGTGIPPGEKVLVALQVEEIPVCKGRWLSTSGHVTRWRHDGDAGYGDEWHETSTRIFLNLDTSFNTIRVGRQLVVSGYVNPVDTAGSSYARLMERRGYKGRMYVLPGNLIAEGRTISYTPGYLAAWLHGKAVGKLDRLGLAPEEAAVVSAMTAGDKRAINPELRQGYSLSGASHLLAVSGLHVGIVFLLVNALLYFVHILPRGHIYKNIIAIGVIWVYAAMAGLSPSVIRASLMFSFAQFALASGSYRKALNIMLGSAVLMLAVNPNYATDPSFLMSYTAVLFITVFFEPIYRLVRVRNKMLKILVSATVVSMVASVGTAPLVSYWFGVIPLAGVLINPLVLVTAHIIVIFGVLWVIMPLGIGAGLFGAVLGAAAKAQNFLVGLVSLMPGASLSFRMPLWGVIPFYIAALCLAVVVSIRYSQRVKTLSLHDND